MIRFKNRDYRIYHVWYNMIRRCRLASKDEFVAYKGCKVLDSFKSESFFQDWWKNQYGADNIGWHLDKDILVKGNKEYGPNTCVIVPREINALMSSKRSRNNLMLGVRYVKRDDIYVAQMNKGDKHCWLGSFKTEIEAFNAYKEAKEQHIKEVAEKWKNEIDPRVYVALNNWTIEVTD